MSGILGWVKQNVVIVIFLVVMVVSVPAGWYFGSKANKKIRNGQQSKADGSYKQLTNTKVSYSLPAVMVGEESPSLPGRVPNDQITALFVKQKEARQAALEEVVQEAIRENQGQHKPLIEGLFPEPARAQDMVLRLEMAKAILGQGGDSIYDRMFKDIGAGPAVDPEKLAVMLQSSRDQEVERLISQGEIKAENDLSKDQEEVLVKKLFSERFGEYQHHAQRISMYADSADQVLIAEELLLEMPTQPPSLGQCFVWQFDIWTYQSILEGIARANAGISGGVEQSVVKQIIEIQLAPLSQLAPLIGGKVDKGKNRRGKGQRGGMFGGEENEDQGPAAGSGSIADLVEPDYTVSLTGRATKPENQVFDTRKARLKLIVSAQRVPTLIDAISTADLMSVLDFDMTSVDLYEKLKEGYYFGTEPVVQVDLEIEILFLRSWTVQYIPPEARKLLSVVEPEVENEDG